MRTRSRCWSWWWIAAPLLLGCAHEMGKQATQGAMEGVKDEAAKSGSPASGAAPTVEKVTGSAVQGSLEQLSTPEQQARLRQLIAGMVAEAVDSASRHATRPAAAGAGSPVEVMTTQATHAFATSLSSELSTGLGPDGRGPLGVQLAAATQGMAASAARGMSAGAREVLPGCDGLSDQQCWQARVEWLSQAAATGFSRGLRHELGWWALLAAFGAGMLIMAALSLGSRWSAWRWPRRSPVREPLPA